MRIIDFQDLIRAMPYKNQSFEIKRKNWKINNHEDYIDGIFTLNDSITLNRYDLYNPKLDTKEFIFKTLMWGYPTKGRGKNIENILEDTNLEKLIKILNDYKDSEISNDQLKNDINAIEGLGLSTMTKFTHFLNTFIDGNKAVILDQQIIGVINSGQFKEFDTITGLTYDNAQKYYYEYLKIIGKLSDSINVDPDQIEMFLFTFGRILSPLKERNRYSFQDKMDSVGDGHFLNNRETLVIDAKRKRKEFGSEESDYRKRLLESYKTLLSIKRNLFTATLNIAMAGELREMEKVFRPGDIYEFSIEQFRNSNDLNLNKLVGLYDQLESVMSSMGNINGIKEDEIL